MENPILAAALNQRLSGAGWTAELLKNFLYNGPPEERPSGMPTYDWRDVYNSTTEILKLLSKFLQVRSIAMFLLSAKYLAFTGSAWLFCHVGFKTQFSCLNLYCPPAIGLVQPFLLSHLFKFCSILLMRFYLVGVAVIKQPFVTFKCLNNRVVWYYKHNKTLPIEYIPAVTALEQLISFCLCSLWGNQEGSGLFKLGQHDP